jgi:uncharacterized membrane protein YhhN
MLMRGIGVAAVSGLCAAIPVHTLARAPGLVLGLVAFAVAFALSSLLLRPLSADDAGWIDRALGGWAYGIVSLAARWMSVGSLRLPSAPS